MSSPQIELEQQLKEAGKMLTDNPFSVDELLLLLDQVETFLSRVEQSPPKSMLDALTPLMNALVEDGLLRHSDVDVKVAVAACISEITRITAPDAPYDDDKMKEVFQLIVSSFENLSDQSSRSYSKRASILETVAKVRSCVVMLDLECDGLIVEMFQHFLKAVRDYHSENVFSSMETIMTLVLVESEDISLEMLTPILASVKKDNEEVLPVAQKLGERVLEKSADKLKPYLIQTVRSLGVSLDDYSQVVASICGGTTGAVEHNDENALRQHLADENILPKEFSDEAAQADEAKPTVASSEEAALVAKESVAEEPCPEEFDPAVDKSPKSVMSNGIMETGNEEVSVDQESSKNPEHDQVADQPNINLASKVGTDDSDAGKSVKPEPKPEQIVKRRGRKSNTIINLPEPSDSSRIDSEREAEKLPDLQKSLGKESPDKDPSIEAAVPSGNEKDTGIPLSSPKAIESEAVNAASSSPSGSLPDESRLKKTGRAKKKQSLIQEDAPSMDVVSTKAPEETSDLELIKPKRRSGKKAPAKITEEDKIPAGVDTSKNEIGTTSDSELIKPQRRSGKKALVLAPATITKEDKVPAGVDTFKKGGTTSDSEAKQLKQSGKKVDAGDSDAKPLRQLVKKGDASDSEAKPLRQSGKKGDTSWLETKPLRQAVRKGDASDSEAKLLKQPGKRGNTKNSVEDKSSLKKEDGKKRGLGKNSTEKHLAKSFTEDDEMGSSLKSTTKSAKDEGPLEETPTTSSKRKRTTGKEKASETIEYDDTLVGSKVQIWWPKDQMFYEGIIHSFDSVKMKHKVVYLDGDEETLNLKKEKWEFVKGDSVPDGEQAAEDQSPDGSSEMHKKKKAKTDSERSPMQEKMEISPKRAGAGSSRKLKSKSGRKSKDDGKVDNKSKDNTSKSSGKSEDDTGGKIKDKSQKSGGRSVDDVTPKASSKSKDADDGTQKTTPKTVNKSKGKTPKANANGSGKVKSSSSKGKESEDGKGKSQDSGKTPEGVKGKSPDTTKARESGGTKSGKKRKKRS